LVSPAVSLLLASLGGEGELGCYWWLVAPTRSRLVPVCGRMEVTCIFSPSMSRPGGDERGGDGVVISGRCMPMPAGCYFLEALVDLVTPGELFNGGPLLAPLPRPLFRWPKGGPRPGALPPLEALCYRVLELAVAAPPSGSSPVGLSRPALVVPRRIGECRELLSL
jgi:hypothetical protein